MTSKRKWQSLILRGDQDFLEKTFSYRQGGYHPVHLNDCLNSRYRVIHKLGHGGYATVWLCQDIWYDGPTYVAIKILISCQSETECRELLMVRRLQEIGIEKQPGGELICLPIDDFRLRGPNGTHVCIVYPVLGPDIGSVMNIFEDGEESDECAGTVRTLGRQVLRGLAALHEQGICHGGQWFWKTRARPD